MTTRRIESTCAACWTETGTRDPIRHCIVTSCAYAEVMAKDRIPSLQSVDVSFKSESQLVIGIVKSVDLRSDSPCRRRPQAGHGFRLYLWRKRQARAL